MSLVISNDITIKDITEQEREQIRDLLTYSNPVYEEASKFGRSTYRIPKYLKLYKEYKNGRLVIPRGTIEKVSKILNYPDDVVDKTIIFPKVEIPSKIKLRDLQGPWVDSLLSQREGIGVASAGFGKTICALEAIVRLGQPVLWITHRKTLINQVIERINTFCDVGKIGIIGEGKCELGEVFTAGMVQSMVKMNLAELDSLFGLIICDEVHNLPSYSFKKVAAKFKARHRYGMTATIYRTDKLENVIFDVIGPCIAKVDREEVINSKGILPAKVVVRKTGVISNQIEYAKVIDELASNQERNDTIIMDVLAEMVGGNICIVLTNRVFHGKLIKDRLKELGVESVHIHATTTKKQREKGFELFKTDKVAVLISTYSLLSEGFDHKKTNRLFFALPNKAKGLIEQAKGRIERTYPGKIDAIVYDYVDDIPMLKRQFETRCEQYNEHNLIILY